MHECNALQILETKKRNTKKPRIKEQWSQRKRNEAQGPCQKDSVSLSLCIQNFLDAPRALESVLRLE